MDRRVETMSFRSATRIVIQGTLAATLALAGGSAVARDDGKPTGCTVEKKTVPGEYTCHMLVACGGGGTTVSLRGVPLTSNPGATPCCLAATYVPPHDELVAGDRRVKSAVQVQGFLIQRYCDPPFSFLGLTFGSWTCEFESQMPLGSYYQYELETCPDPPPASPPTN
jgi:hypothetical protein